MKLFYHKKNKPEKRENFSQRWALNDFELLWKLLKPQKLLSNKKEIKNIFFQIFERKWL
jgi:hypothetical protein